MKFSRLAASVGIFAALTASVSGCSPSAPADVDQPSDHVLTLSMPAAPPSLAVGSLDQGVSSYVWASVYDSLLTRDLSGAVQPSVAEEYAVADDGLTLTFTIRDGMKFSTGEPVDAEAVADSLTFSSTAPATSAAFASVASIEATDESTVTLSLSRPDTALPYQLAQAAGVIGEPSTLGSETAALDPVGSGPYVLDNDATTDGSTYTLELRPDYWNADAYSFKKVIVSVIADATAQQNALQAGQLDFMSLANPAQGESLTAAGFTVQETAPVAWGAIVIADRAGEIQPALGDVRVRQAINLAVDRDAIVEKLLAGVGAPTEQIFDPGSGAYDADLDGTYAYDLAEAKALMEEAGYADGFTVSMPSSVLSQTMEPTLTQQLGEIGITVEWKPVPFDQVVSVLGSKTYPMYWFINGYNVPQIVTNDTLTPTGYLNPFGATDPELTALLETAADASAEDADTAYRAVNQWSVDNAWFAPLYAYAQLVVTSKAVTFTPRTVAGLLTVEQFQPAS
ncbi:ABC transporter substrate-binding protein [Herbiconiux ginsengi]|uniref:Peptide/nickel transport system substrate-binding protein n=1 Tax=Herbiconiux ginsengi TaxID=381665 RepID=A0A1H3TG63_9MICO|nr:ABC transporter substrate-binding protein [Herbiconiux ginsengi]SDZ49214.1 peptide/nickel transport system substrate-binding protein [Herbiconiux ginsengi]